MSNKQRRGWRGYIYGSIIGGPLIIAFLSYRTTNDRSFASLIGEVDSVAIGLWFILLGAAWLRAKKHEGRAERHWRAVQGRTGPPIGAESAAKVEALLLDAKKHVLVAEVMWMVLLILFGLLRLVVHYMGQLTGTFDLTSTS